MSLQSQDNMSLIPVSLKVQDEIQSNIFPDVCLCEGYFDMVFTTTSFENPPPPDTHSFELFQSIKLQTILSLKLEHN